MLQLMGKFLVRVGNLSTLVWQSYQPRKQWPRYKKQKTRGGFYDYHDNCKNNNVQSSQINCFIIWLASRAGKMNQIARCDWLPERARWSHLARSGLYSVSRKQNFTKSHIINPSLTKFERSRWLNIGLLLFWRVY